MTQVVIPPLNEGETYLCGFVDANGDVEHVAIVAINNERAEWQEQMGWTKALGADLMTRAGTGRRLRATQGSVPGRSLLEQRGCR